MKKHLFIGLSLIALLLGCSTDEEVNRSDFKALSFETFVGKGTTRAIAKTSFADGDDFGVFAYRHGTDSWSADVPKESFMDNVRVSRQSGAWTYTPLKYWDEGINHTFLAYSPYNASYMLGADGLLWGVTTAAKASEQADLLYSFPELGSKNLTWKDAGTKVVISFRHALSQIKLSASTDQDYSGYYAARVRRVRLVGIGDTGNLNLDAADAETSPWSNQGSSLAEGAYAATTEALDIPLGTTETLLNPGNNLFMQIPQEVVNDGTAYFEVTYDIDATEAGNASNAGTGKTAIIRIPDITWEHNRIYHYKIQMDLQQLLNLRPIEVGEPDVIEWEAGAETKLPEDLTVTIESNTGDTPQTGTGNATLGITKSNEAGGTQNVKIENPEKDDQWIVEVGPEITDAATARTRAESSPADWLRVCRDGESREATKLYGTEDASIQIKITQENTSTKQRKAEVIIRRALSGVTRIVVTQEPAPAAIIEANSTQFTMEGGTNQLTIVNKSTASWTLSKSSGADWLSLQDTDGNTVTSGTAEQVVKAIATRNDTSKARTATITLSRDGQEPVLVEVTQAAPQPMSVSANNFSFTYLNGFQTLAVTNPEGEKDGFGWTLEGTAPDWLAVAPTSGTGTKGTVTFVAQTNTAATARTSAQFTLKRLGQADIPITVGQGGAPATTISPAAMTIDYFAHSGTFNVSSPSGIPWTLVSNDSWITFTPASGNGNAKIVYTVTANPSTTSLRTTIAGVLRNGESKPSAGMAVVQSKAPVPEITVTPKIFYGTAKQVGGYILSYKVDAPAGVQWTATVNTRYAPLHNYIIFPINNSKTYTGTGPGGFAVTVKGYTYSSSGYTGAIDITPVGGKTIQAGIILNP